MAKACFYSLNGNVPRERVAEWLRRLTRKPKFRTAVGSNPTLDSLVAVRNSSPGQPEPCEGKLVAVAGSCGGLMVKHPWPLLEISLSDFRRLATLNTCTYLPIESPLCTLQSGFLASEKLIGDSESAKSDDERQID